MDTDKMKTPLSSPSLSSLPPHPKQFGEETLIAQNKTMTPLYSTSSFSPPPSSSVDPLSIFPSIYHPTHSITTRPHIVPDQNSDDDLINLLLNLNLSLKNPNPSFSPSADYSTYGQDSMNNSCFSFERHSDEFMMSKYKVKECGKKVVHDWTKCPYAHNGERAVRRDPNKYPYTGLTCNEFRKTGKCSSGLLCDNAHGIFEFWLHPTRFKTRMCEMGLSCNRQVCFFAHTPSQKRPVVYHDNFPKLAFERENLMKKEIDQKFEFEWTCLTQKETQKGKLPDVINWGDQEDVDHKVGSTYAFDETWSVDEVGFNELCKGFEDYPYLDLVKDLLMKKK